MKKALLLSTPRGVSSDHQQYLEEIEAATAIYFDPKRTIGLPPEYFDKRSAARNRGTKCSTCGHPLPLKGIYVGPIICRDCSTGDYYQRYKKPNQPPVNIQLEELSEEEVSATDTQ